MTVISFFPRSLPSAYIHFSTVLLDEQHSLSSVQWSGDLFLWFTAARLTVISYTSHSGTTCYIFSLLCQHRLQIQLKCRYSRIICRQWLPKVWNPWTYKKQISSLMIFCEVFTTVSLWISLSFILTSHTFQYILVNCSSVQVLFYRIWPNLTKRICDYTLKFISVFW